MAPRADFRPIIPRTNPFPGVLEQQSKLLLILRNIGRQGQNDLSKYPTAATSYRRSGELGRKWTVAGPKFSGNNLLVRVGNNADHAPFVQGPTKGSGPRQRDLFKDLGWPNVTDVSERVFNRNKPAIIKVLRGK